MLAGALRRSGWKMRMRFSMSFHAGSPEDGAQALLQRPTCGSRSRAAAREEHVHAEERVRLAGVEPQAWSS